MERKSSDTGDMLAAAGRPAVDMHCMKALAANIGGMDAESTCLNDGNRV